MQLFYVLQICFYAMLLARTRSAMAVRKANGERISGRIPYGHTPTIAGVA